MRELKIIRIEVHQATMKEFLPPKHTTSTGFYLTHDQVKTIMSSAESTKLSVSGHIGKAINSYLEDIDTQDT